MACNGYLLDRKSTREIKRYLGVRRHYGTLLNTYTILESIQHLLGICGKVWALQLCEKLYGTARVYYSVTYTSKNHSDDPPLCTAVLTNLSDSSPFGSLLLPASAVLLSLPMACDVKPRPSFLSKTCRRLRSVIEIIMEHVEMEWLPWRQEEGQCFKYFIRRFQLTFFPWK